jgi:hypothetical protein
MLDNLKVKNLDGCTLCPIVPSIEPSIQLIHWAGGGVILYGRLEIGAVLSCTMVNSTSRSGSKPGKSSRNTSGSWATRMSSRFLVVQWTEGGYNGR